MMETDVAIVGGGLAGSLVAAMLGRASIKAVLIDPHVTYPPDFRCEKLGGTQLARLEKTGLLGAVLKATTHDKEVWIARSGYLLDKKPSDQFGIHYDRLVSTMRAQIPLAIALIHAKAVAIATTPDRQRITLSNGFEISARLAVLANGLSVGVRDSLGLARHVVSPCHSISIGFDLAPVGRPAFEFPALTYYPERPSDRIAYLTAFPIGGGMRVNLMVYRDVNDPWLRIAADAGSGSERSDAAIAQVDGRCPGDRPGQNPPGGFVCHRRPSPGGAGVGRRRIRDVLPSGWNRHRQGLHRCGTPV